jgi:hypothetical protein
MDELEARLHRIGQHHFRAKGRPMSRVAGSMAAAPGTAAVLIGAQVSHSGVMEGCGRIAAPLLDVPRGRSVAAAPAG